MSAEPLNVFRCRLAGLNLVEASAGTGKTWNLCGLYLRLLLERGLEVRQILVVTFTNAATAELRERIRARLVETLASLKGEAVDSVDPFVGTLLETLRREHGADDGRMRQQLAQAVQTFDEASIFTIHGFCQRALADAPFTAGMPMVLELLTDDGPMRLQVVQDFWRRRIAGDALPGPLAAYLTSRQDTPQTHARLLKRRLDKPWARLRWPQGLDAATVPDPAALQALHARLRAQWPAVRDVVLAIVEEALPRLNGNVYREASPRQALQAWDAWMACDDALDASGAHDKLAHFGSTKLRPKKGQAPPREHAFFDAAQALLDERARVEGELRLCRLRLLRELVEDGPRILREAKRERRVIGFDDMLGNLQARLVDGGTPGLAAALAQRFPAALIDEFQDTDPLQFGIFQALHAGGLDPLFLIGDPKQAIYSFRHADLHTYLHARSLAQAEYTLADNQRSTGALLRPLNGLFGAQPQAFLLEGLDYHPVGEGIRRRKPLVDARAGPPAPALQLWQLPRQDDGEPIGKGAATRWSAQACAAEIARLLAAAQRGEITHDGRPLRAGDCAVLVRSHRHGGLMRRALAALGVGSVELSRASLFTIPQARDLERLLAAILEPAREGLLRAALATELMGEEATSIDALGADEPRLLEVVGRFAAWREAWLQRGIGVMLRQWMREARVPGRLLARPDGERQLTNLLHLAECLQGAAAEHPAPETLLRWLELQRRDEAPAEAAQLRLESDRHLVQIVTIHKSKGLEYPLVFCPFLWDGAPGPADTTPEGLEYHDDDGALVMDFREPEPAHEKEIKARAKRERAAENLRLVYVALTRAIHRCWVTVGNYRSGPAATDGEAQRHVLNWLVGGAGFTPESWLGSSKGPPRPPIEAAWAAWAAAHAPDARLDPLPQDAGEPLPPDTPAPESLVALVPVQPRPPAWWIGSYSSLAHGTRSESAAVDHDTRTAAGVVSSPVSVPVPVPFVPGPDDILHFPRGPLAGECLHALFERIDFTQPAGWPAAIESALRLRPQPDRAARPGQQARMLAGMLDDVMHTLLPDLPGAPGGADWRLADVPTSRRLVELEFHLPAPRLEADALAALLRTHGMPVPALHFATLQGYLRGFVDLVVEQAGRFHLIDWKSNHLGSTPAHYGAGPMQEAAIAHGYPLQLLLYTVALHRHLQRRVRGYDYDRHVGNAMLLFVRGVRPGWKQADGRPAGVHVERPSKALVEALATMLAPRRVAA